MDGSCVVHAFTAGLKWLYPDRTPPHARELRAGVVTHLKQHQDRYQGMWDKCDTNGAPVDGLTYEGYCDLGKQSTYASDLELRALARNWQVNIVLIPADIKLEPEAFTTQKAKHTVAFWLSDKHVDLLLPTRAKITPKSFWPSARPPPLSFVLGAGLELRSVLSRPLLGLCRPGAPV